MNFAVGYHYPSMNFVMGIIKNSPTQVEWNFEVCLQGKGESMDFVVVDDDNTTRECVKGSFMERRIIGCIILFDLQKGVSFIQFQYEILLFVMSYHKN